MLRRGSTGAGMADNILIGRGDKPCELLLSRANRHGLVAGATGKVLAGPGKKRHCLSARSTKVKRQNTGTQVLRHQDGVTVMQWAPYGLVR